MKEILLNSYGETLTPCREISGLPHEETDLLTGDVGLHSCNSWVKIKIISPTHNVLACKSCNLRMVIPNHIGTYKDLREYLDLTMSKKKEK